MAELSSFRGLIRNALCASVDGSIDSSGRQTVLGSGVIPGYWATLFGHGAPVEVDPNAVVPALASGGTLILWSASVLPSGLEEFGTGKTLVVPAVPGSTLQLTEIKERQGTCRRVFVTVDSVNFATGVVSLTRRHVTTAIVTHSAGAGMGVNPHSLDNTATFNMNIIGILWSGGGVYPLSMGTIDQNTKQGVELVVRHHPTQWIANALTPIIRSMTADFLVTPAIREARLETYLESLPSRLSSSFPRVFVGGTPRLAIPDQLDHYWRVQPPMYADAGSALQRRTLVLNVPGVGTASRVVLPSMLPEGAMVAEGNPWVNNGWNFPLAAQPWGSSLPAFDESDDPESAIPAVTRAGWRDSRMHGMMVVDVQGTEASPIHIFGSTLWAVSLYDPVSSQPFSLHYSPIHHAVERTSTTAYIEAAKTCFAVSPMDLEGS